MTSQPMGIKMIGSDNAKFPFIPDAWSFFAVKGIKTVVLSIGSSYDASPELDIAESLGCPVHIFDITKDNLENWETVKVILKARKPQENMTEFAKVALKKWVLPRNIHTNNSLPLTHDGTIIENSNTYTTINASNAVKGVCEKMGLDEVRIDILKIDIAEKESAILNSFLLEGFRPSFILVNWTRKPSEDFTIMSTAGNLQMQGYALVGKEENKYLYYYTGENMYESESWDEINTDLKNPLIKTVTTYAINKVQRFLNDKAGSAPVETEKKESTVETTQK